MLRGCWYNYIVLNMQAPSEEKSDDSKVIFYEDLEQVIFKLKIGNESLHQNSIGNGVRIRNIATLKNSTF